MTHSGTYRFDIRQTDYNGGDTSLIDTVEFPEGTRPARIRSNAVRGVPLTAVDGEIDISTSALVQSEVNAQLARRPPVLVLDLSEVTFLGLVAVRLLVESQREADRVGTRLIVVASASAVLRVLALTTVDTLLDLRPDINSATQAA